MSQIDDLILYLGARADGVPSGLIDLLNSLDARIEALKTTVTALTASSSTAQAPSSATASSATSSPASSAAPSSTGA